MAFERVDTRGEMVYNGARIIDSSKQPMPGKSRSYLLAREGLSGLEAASKVRMIERHPEGDNRKAHSQVDLSGRPPLWPEGDSLYCPKRVAPREKASRPWKGMGGFCSPWLPALPLLDYR